MAGEFRYIIARPRPLEAKRRVRIRSKPPAPSG